MFDQYSKTRPNVGVTVVPFIYEDGVIKTLVYKRSKNAEVFKGLLSLPNCFFDITNFNDLNKAAESALLSKTNVKIPRLTQFQSFSGDYIDPDRITTVNVAFYSLLKKEEVEVSKEEAMHETYWLPVLELKNTDMAFNHNEVLDVAYDRLLKSAEYTINPAILLDNSFTIKDLRELTEYLLNTKLDNSRFRDRIKKSGLLVELDGEFKTGSNRPAQLYCLNENYDKYFYPRSLTKSS